MGDVTAVCLTLGEETTERALASIGRQTLPVAETIVVEGVEPFHRAFNLAASRVETPFFVQVDSDMVLDPTCVDDLRTGLHPQAAVTGSLLRDPLLGRLPAVKLFRTLAVAGLEAPSTIAPEVDHYRQLGDAGWLTLYVLGQDARVPSTRYTRGEHAPAYTEPYTWATYVLLGSRFRYLRDRVGFIWRRDSLRRSSHPMAWIARIALCEGLFRTDAGDVSKAQVEATWPNLSGERTMPGWDGVVRRVERSLRLPSAPERFSAFYRLGRELREAAAGGTVKRVLWLLGVTREVSGGLAEIAFCRGLSVASGGSASAEFEQYCDAFAVDRAPV